MPGGAVMATLQGYHYRESDLVVVNLSIGYGATTRYARVEYASQYGDALTLVDVTGKELVGEIVSMRSMTPLEEREWFAFGEEDDADWFADESEQKEVA